MSPIENTPGRTCRVLVVDDSAAVRRMVATRLRCAGFDVAEAANGNEALRSVQDTPAEVVVTDVSMPGLGGLELLAALRREGGPEVILLTGTRADDAQSAIQALRLGAHDYIPKTPAALEAVVLAVERAVEKWRLREENTRLLDQLRHLSLTDSLTRLGNRRAFDAALRQETARARRDDTSFSLALLDLDHFKRINDSLGHPAGDRVLVSLAERLLSAARESDGVFRFGGEEFALILPATPLEGGVFFAERLRSAIAVRPLPAGGRDVDVTLSAGVAELEPNDDDRGVSLLARADAALYEAKGCGRNRVVAAGGRPGPRCDAPVAAAGVTAASPGP